MTYTAEQISRFDTNAWIHPTTGAERFYLTDDAWHALVGLWISQYNTGNISAATLDGEHLSNTKATKLTLGKVWFEDGALRAQHLPEDLVDKLVDAVAAKVAEDDAAAARELVPLAVLSTSAVAQLLGITAQAVPLKMSRAGVEPLGRAAGRGGKNQYPRAAVLAMLKTDTPASTVLRTEYIVSHEVLVNLPKRVVYLDPETGNQMLVNQLKLIYQNVNQQQPRWSSAVVLCGWRVLKSGKTGATVAVTKWQLDVPELEFARRELAIHAPEGYDPA